MTIHSSTFFLKFIGFKKGDLYSDLNDNNDIIINLDSTDNTLMFRDTNESHKYIKYIAKKINNISTFITSIIILLPYIYSIYLSINEWTLTYMLYNNAQLLFFVQFWVGYKYINSEHFTILLTKNTDYITKINKHFKLIILLSFVLSSILVLIFNLDGKITIYSDIKEHNSDKNVLSSIYMFYEKFLNYNIILVNVYIFSSNILITNINMKKYVDELTVKVVNYENLKILNIIKDYLELKSDHEVIVTKLNTIFSSITFLGLFTLYFISKAVTNNHYGYNELLNAFVIAITFIVYTYSIVNVHTSIDKMNTTISSDRFVLKYFDVNNTLHINIPFDDDYSEDVSLEHVGKLLVDIKSMVYKQRMTSLTHSNYINWLVLSEILKSKWTPFNLIIYKIYNANDIYKLGTILLGLSTLSFVRNIF